MKIGAIGYYVFLKAGNTGVLCIERSAAQTTPRKIEAGGYGGSCGTKHGSLGVVIQFMNLVWLSPAQNVESQPKYLEREQFQLRNSAFWEQHSLTT